MDTISQFVLGALSADLAVKRSAEQRGRLPFWILGGVTGSLPDLDILIRSSSDAMLAVEYHRHFTHAIAFIPLGALIGILFFWPWLRREKEKIKYYYWAALWAYGTHWILDSLTSYGTQIFRPFSDYRFSLDILSIVDPLVTIPWIIGICLAVIYKTRKPAALAMAWFCFYLALCSVNQYKAKLAQEAIASSRGHVIQRSRALPTLGNSFLFRSIYEYDGRLYADSVLVTPWSEKFYLKRGDSVAKASRRDFSMTDEKFVKDLDRWIWFVDEYAFVVNMQPLQIGDGRYTLTPHGWNTLWAWQVDNFSPYRAQKANSMATLSPRERNPLATFKLIFYPEQEMELCSVGQQLTCQSLAMK